MAANAQVDYVGKPTIASKTLFGYRAVTRLMDRLYYIMGWVCGLELLLLGFFITCHGRHLGFLVFSKVGCPCTH